MRQDTIRRKKAIAGLRKVSGEDWMRSRMPQICAEGKRAFHGLRMDLDKMLAESILCLERGVKAGPGCEPTNR